MATFSPPTDNLVYWAEPYTRGILRHLQPGPRGRNVFKMTDGSFTESEPTDYTLVARTFHGGHVHPLTATEQAELIAAGYGSYIT